MPPKKAPKERFKKHEKQALKQAENASVEEVKAAVKPFVTEFSADPTATLPNIGGMWNG